jgi:hypothetical protein
MILTPRNKNKITADGATMSIHRIFSVGTESARSLSETKAIWLSLVQIARFMNPYRSFLLLRIQDVKRSPNRWWPEEKIGVWTINHVNDEKG